MPKKGECGRGWCGWTACDLRKGRDSRGFVWSSRYDSATLSTVSARSSFNANERVQPWQSCAAFTNCFSRSKLAHRYNRRGATTAPLANVSLCLSPCSPLTQPPPPPAISPTLPSPPSPPPSQQSSPTTSGPRTATSPPPFTQADQASTAVPAPASRRARSLRINTRRWGGKGKESRRHYVAKKHESRSNGDAPFLKGEE